MELGMRERILSFLSVVMRVPPLFVIDELLRIGLGLTDETVVFNSTEYGPMIESQNGGIVDSVVTAAGNSVFNAGNWSGASCSTLMYSIYSYQIYFMTATRFLAYGCSCLAAACTFMLLVKHLLIVYLYLITEGVVFLSYWSNLRTVGDITAYLNTKDGGSILVDVLNLQFTQLMTNGPGIMIIQNIILQYTLGLVYCEIHLAPRNSYLQKILIYSFTLSSQVIILPLPPSILSRLPIIAALIPLAVCKFVLWYNINEIKNTIYMGYQHGRALISNYGLSALAESQWSRLQVPSVLRTFWILRVSEQVVQILCNEYGNESFSYYGMIKTLMVNGCDTLTAVLGMTSIISVICHYIGSFFHWVLLIDDEDEKSIGTVSAMLFYILALQTGLTSLDKENRLLRLCRNLCLLFTAVLHFVHNIVNPLLMSLSASHNSSLHKHVRALAVCVYLIVFPAWLLSFLWSRYTISTWLLAVTVFSIEVIIKVFVSLAIYSLFLYDAYRKSFWDELDNWIYIIRSFGNTVEFAFGIILFFNGFWILVFEAGGTIRAIMMCVHAYFNLWCEAKAGWGVFMKRRHAVNKINSLPEASERQLAEHADVCAICYQEMESAKITKCNHLFHGVCLRKWLYVQDRCPLCHDIMYKVPNQRDNNEPQQPEEQARNDEADSQNEIAGVNQEAASVNMLNPNDSQNNSNAERTSSSTSDSRREQAVEER